MHYPEKDPTIERLWSAVPRMLVPSRTGVLPASGLAVTRDAYTKRTDMRLKSWQKE